MVGGKVSRGIWVRSSRWGCSVSGGLWGGNHAERANDNDYGIRIFAVDDRFCWTDLLYLWISQCRLIEH